MPHVLASTELFERSAEKLQSCRYKHGFASKTVGVKDAGVKDFEAQQVEIAHLLEPVLEQLVGIVRCWYADEVGTLLKPLVECFTYTTTDMGAKSVEAGNGMGGKNTVYAAPDLGVFESYPAQGPSRMVNHYSLFGSTLCLRLLRSLISLDFSAQAQSDGDVRTFLATTLAAWGQHMRRAR